MSRAHMIYDDKPLQQAPVKTTRWERQFVQSEVGNSSGPGVLLEGVFMKKVKHIIVDTSGAKLRFVVLTVEFSRAHQRKFDEKGHEIEPNFGLTAKVNTGYLNSSYKTQAKGHHDILDYAEVCRRLHCQLTEVVQPDHSQCVVLWGDEGSYDHVELEVGQPVRVKTKGDSPFIDSLTKLDTDQKVHAANYAGGEKAGKSWTDRVMNVKQTTEEPKVLPQDTLEGVDEDEWDD